jgi:predicted esterase
MKIVQPTASHTHTVIFLHGRGDDGLEFAKALFESQASNKQTLPEAFPHVKWVRRAPYIRSYAVPRQAFTRETHANSKQRSFHLQIDYMLRGLR